MKQPVLPTSVMESFSIELIESSFSKIEMVLKEKSGLYTIVIKDTGEAICPSVSVHGEEDFWVDNLKSHFTELFTTVDFGDVMMAVEELKKEEFHDERSIEI